jgi:hypothetical protein
MKNDFSLLGKSFAEAESELELQRLIALVPPFTKAESTKEAVARRRERALDYAFFDTTYFPPEAYTDGYSKPNAFHARIAQACREDRKTVTLILGPNGYAKSVTIYKHDIWAVLTGARHFIVYVSETLKTPAMIIRALKLMMKTNKRITHDWPDLEFISDSIEYLHVRTNLNPVGTVFAQASMDSSIRGTLANLTQRPDLVHVTDMENRTSSMTPGAVDDRRAMIEEIRNALSPHGCVTIDANNFDERCLTNQYVKDAKKGILDERFIVLSYPAWGLYYDKRGRFRLGKGASVEGPLWRERFPAETEGGLKTLMGSSSEADWQGGQQQRPKKPEGFYFKRAHHQIWTALPDGPLLALTYVDPNLSKKSKGNKTSLGALLYSMKTQEFYCAGIRYRSWSDPAEMLDALRLLWQNIYSLKRATLICAGMDGNVTQESNWSAHVANYCRINQVMVPPIDYKRYDVRMIAKIAQTFWAQNKVYFPDGFAYPEEETLFFDDFYAFTGRKLPGGHDDAPDWFCCIMQMAMEIGLGAQQGPDVQTHGAFHRSGLVPFRGSKRM